MTSFLDPLIAFVSAHAWLAYLTLFLAALLEAVPVVGSLVPGSTIILALSALVPGGELKLVPVLAAAAAGAMLGDGTAYLIGYRSRTVTVFQWRLLRWYPARIASCSARSACTRSGSHLRLTSRGTPSRLDSANIFPVARKRRR